MQFEVGKKYKIVKEDALNPKPPNVQFGGTNVQVGDVVVCSGVDESGDAMGYGLTFKGITSDYWFFAAPEHLESGCVVLIEENEE